MKGIDISEYQTNVDYSKLKSQGIEFAIIRCGYGKNASQKDAEFEKHYAGCKNAGLKVGCYLFSYASTVDGAKAEALNCLNFIKGKQFDMPIFYDVEDEGTTGQADKYTITEMCKTFCETLINAGYMAGVYASLYWFNDKMYIQELEKYNIWLAQWNDKIMANFRVDIWQYTNKGKVEGIGGRVDMNECYKYFDFNGNSGNESKTQRYENGSTKEAVYADTKSTHCIGYLNAWEKCDCLGIYQNRAIVRYIIDGTENYKIGFVEWLRRRKIMDFLFGLIIGNLIGVFLMLAIFGEGFNNGRSNNKQ